jgi:hypothetical protein
LRVAGLHEIALDAFGVGRVLQQGIEQRHELGAASIAAGDVTHAGLATGQRYHAAGHRHFADVERRARPAGAATHHHQACLGRLEAAILGHGRQAVHGRLEVLRLQTGQD